MNEWIAEIERLKKAFDSALKMRNEEHEEVEKLKAEVIEWKSLCFAQGMKLKGLEVENKALLEALNQTLSIILGLETDLFNSVVENAKAAITRCEK